MCSVSSTDNNNNNPSNRPDIMVSSAASIISSSSGHRHQVVMEDMASVGCLPEASNMRGLFDLPEDGVVSSLALTPDGCYVFAGMGGGEVRLYAQALRTVGAASRNGTTVAQIRSKVRCAVDVRK